MPPLHAAARSSASHVERLMSAALALGLFQYDPGTGTYRNNAQSAVLRRDHPNSVQSFVHHQIEDSYRIWGRLHETMTEASEDVTALERELGKGTTLWSHYAAHPQQVCDAAPAPSRCRSHGRGTSAPFLLQNTPCHPG